MPSKTTFDLRVIGCHTCGAPLEIGVAGGLLRCSFCRHQQHATAARERVSFGCGLSEAQRLAELAQQDARPPSRKWIAELLVGDELLPWTVGQALDRYRRLHQSLREQLGDGPTAREQLWELTLVLAGHFGDRDDLLRQRALLEGALEVLSEPRHRQTIYAQLAVSAARAGDTVAAGSWLGLCDPRADELRSDSFHRFARAYVETASSRWQAVLETLGNGWQGVPLSDDIEPACVVLRAHAWEQLGDPARALELLDHYFRHCDGYRRFQAQRFAQRQPWPLCPTSLPQAEERQRQRGIALLGKTSGSPKLSLILSLSFLGAAVLTTLILVTLVGVGWAVYALGFGVVLSSAFLAILSSDRRLYRRALRLRAEGLRALATVIHVNATGRATMGVPQLRYRLLVIPAQQAPFEAYNALHADGPTRQRLAPGNLVMVRFDPADRSNVHVEVD